jgi:hypothetical protein
MDRTSLHLEIRNALSVSDELSRYEHYFGQDELAGSLSALRSALGDLERVVGRSHEDASLLDPEMVASVERARESIMLRRHDVPRSLRRRTAKLLASAQRVSVASRNPDERVPSKPVLGGLPLARAVPQDLHSVLDYVYSACLLASAAAAKTNPGRVMGVLLGAKLGGVAAITDARFSVAKIVPIELHASVDYAVGIAAIAAPFVLGYAKKDPVVAMLHVGVGVGTLLTSLLTDYRASKGVTWPTRSNGGPHVGAPRHA